MYAVLRTQPTRSSFRAATAAARVVCSHPRMYATIPDPTQPSDTQSDIPKPKAGSNNTLLIVGGLTAVAGAYYYLTSTSQASPEAQRKLDEERVKEKVNELHNAGKTTAHDVVREGENRYEETMSQAQEKLTQARVQADRAANEARSAAARQYDSARASVTGATHKVEQTYEEAAKKTKEEAQSWNQWFWSWFGYGKKKTEETKREGAQKVAEGAQKVEQEAQKRT